MSKPSSIASGTVQGVGSAPGSRFVLAAIDVWRAQREGPPGISQRQDMRLKSLVAFARATSPFFTDHLKTVPSDTLKLSDIPPVTKAALVERYDQWFTDRRMKQADLARFLADPSAADDLFMDRYMAWSSSGSSGQPVMLLHDRGSRNVQAAVSLVRGSLAEASAGELCALVIRRLTGKDRQAWVYWVGARSPAMTSARMRRRNPRYARQSRVFSVFDPIAKVVGELNEYRPLFLASYSSTLALLAEEKLAGRLRIHPERVAMAGENLDAESYQRIREAFGHHVHEHYSAAETGQIASACEQGFMHLNADWLILEPVDSSLAPVKPGEASHSVLVTNLANHVQPIIRYQLNDSVTMQLEPCACGNPLPAFKLHGRSGGFLEFPGTDGNLVKVAPLTLIGVVLLSPGVRRYQVEQTEPSTLVLKIEPVSEDVAELAWQSTEQRLRAFLASEGITYLTIIRSPELPAPDPRSGKFPQVWSSVARNSAS